MSDSNPQQGVITRTTNRRSMLPLVARFRKWRRWEWLALFIILAVSIWQDAVLLMRYPLAVGLDGYYYVLQIEELYHHNSFYFPTRTPLVFYALLGLRYLTGDTILAIKVGSIIFHALLCAGIFALLIRVTRSAWLGLLGSALVAFSPLHLFMLAEYIKNLGAVTLLVWGGWATIRAFQTRATKWAMASVTLLLAASLSHKSALGLIALLAVLAVVSAGLTYPNLSVRYRVVALLVILILWITPQIVAIQSYFEVPPWLRRELSRQPHWPLQIVGVSEGFILLLISPAILFLLANSKSKLQTTANLTLGAVALWSLVLSLNPFLNSDPGLLTISGRLGYLLYLQVAILLPGFFWLVASTYKKAILYVAALTLPLFLLSLRSPLPQGLRSDYLQRRILLTQNLPASLPQLGPMPIVIAPHGDQFLLTSVLGIPSQQRLPENNQGRMLFWLFDQFDCRMLTSSTIILYREGSQLCTILIEDNQLQQLLRKMAENERHRLLSANPYFREAHQLNR